MQNFIDQAAKNGIELSNRGICQFCGAAFQKGIYECMDHYNEGLELLDFSQSENHFYRFLSVDAHALQHPEIHGRWSNHFHLTRLYLILEKNLPWDYQKSPRLSDYLNAYKLKRPDEVFIVPLPLERGKWTSKDLSMVRSADECKVLIKKWAHEVYQSWHLNHSLISEIGNGFLVNELEKRR